MGLNNLGDTMNDKLNYINIAIQTANLVKPTLGPNGMNCMVFDDKNNPIITNDGATILKQVKIDNPIGFMIRNLAKSQEEIGDGTTTACVFAAKLLENSIPLLQNIHPTILIKGYSLAANQAIDFLLKNQFETKKENIIKTCFGSKIPIEQVNHLTNLLKNVDYKKLKLFKNKADPLKSKIIKGYIFSGYTMNDRMPSEVEGNIAVLDLKSNIEYAKLNLNKAEELKKLQSFDRNYKKEIINELVKKKVKCVFVSDTNPEFETLLTEKGIMGIVTYKRETLDGICQATDTIASADPKEINIGKGKVTYKLSKIIIENPKSQIETLQLNGQTEQILDEVARAVDDVVGILKYSKVVRGAGNIEVALSLHLNEFAKQIGGKEQIAIEAFARALEIIPLTLAENCGLDAVEILSNLKTLFSRGETDYGVDVIRKISKVSERGIFEPTQVKIHAISSATNLVNLILKLDKILVGKNEKNEN